MKKEKLIANIIELINELIDKTENDNDPEFHYLLNDFLAIFNKKKNKLDNERFNRILKIADKAFCNTKPNPLGLNLPEIIERQKLNPLK